MRACARGTPPSLGRHRVVAVAAVAVRIGAHRSGQCISRAPRVFFSSLSLFRSLLRLVTFSRAPRPHLESFRVSLCSRGVAATSSAPLALRFLASFYLATLLHVSPTISFFFWRDDPPVCFSRSISSSRSLALARARATHYPFLRCAPLLLLPCSFFSSSIRVCFD